MLGPLEVQKGDQRWPVTGRLRQTLLGVLLARAERVVSADVLVDALWGEREDARAHQRLHLHVHRLRGFLGEHERLSRIDDGYRLRVRQGELDAERFERLVAEGFDLAEREPRESAGLLRTALGLWHGTPFRGVDAAELGDWANRLEERRLTAWESLYRAELACGAGAELVEGLQKLALAHPLRERFHSLLMSALDRAGRREEARAAYERARRTLAQELGVEPGAELRESAARLRSGRAPSPGPAPGGAVLPSQLPSEVGGFVGREAEMDELDVLVSSSPAPVVIAAVAGTAGVGKTALAVRWAHRRRDRFPDGQLYVDLRGYGPDQPLAPEDALAGFLRALGLAGSAIPHDLHERGARFRTLVAGRRMLVLLDNAAEVAQVRPLLAGSPSCVTLVTSRDALAGLVVREGARRLALDRLSRAEARELLRGLLGDARLAAEPAAVDELVERCARLPLALRIAAELVRSHPGPGGVAELAGALGPRRRALDLLDIDDPHTAVRAVFSWSYRRLEPAVASVFRRLGPYPGPDVDEYAVAALVGVEPRAARRALEVLVRGHLVERSPTGRYRLHDLLRAYAAELTGTPDGGGTAERAAALGRLSDYYLSTALAAMDVFLPAESFRRPRPPEWPGAAPPFASSDEARAWLDAERANLLELARISEPRRTVELAETLWRYLFLGGFPDEAMHLYTRELAAARALADPIAEARARSNLGKTMDQLGLNGTVALDHLRGALAAFERAGLPAWQSAVRNNLGIAFGRRGDLGAAIREFELSLALAGTAEHWPLRRAPLVNLSRCLKELGRYEEALTCLFEVLERCREHDDRAHLPNALTGLADLSLLTGRDAEAEAYARDGLALAGEYGFRAVEVDCLCLLGVVARTAGDHATALLRHQEAVALARSIGSRHTVLGALSALAASRSAAGDQERALATYREALAVAREADHAPGVATVRAAIDDLLARGGDQRAART
ncbi:BTAD domain-containing putative transcriptional regulator [Streptomyces profundus]|uniref:BTAD domain-containing putative transcriptional regulator n=1 Tax=Streptomyces profundus TaxID=2867410 RepID=UPI001D16E8F5|nr:BTAD domain-containing putative transcriptional regulator [Streptomyces sp. MA3_2.13]UED85544.1 tetratricopeptide repeat protein [Streptomyces sp. MA3_2.13]